MTLLIVPPLPASDIYIQSLSAQDFKYETISLLT